MSISLGSKVQIPEASNSKLCLKCVKQTQMLTLDVQVGQQVTKSWSLDSGGITFETFFIFKILLGLQKKSFVDFYINSFVRLYPPCWPHLVK